MDSYIKTTTLNELCDLITKQTGFDYSKTIKPSLVNKKIDGYLPFIQNKDFEGERINLNTDYYVPSEIAKKYPKILLDSTILLISISGKIGNVGFYNIPQTSFVGGAICVCRLNKDVNGKYIMYFLQSSKGQFLLLHSVKAASHSNITVEDIRKLPIPIPSLSEQSRIVGILDSFTDSIENLKQQIAQRRKQYEHYRDQLLDLEGKEGVEMKTILDVCESNRGVRVIKKELKESGDFPVFQNSITPMGYYHKCNYKKPTTFVITAGAAGEVGFCDTPFWAADDCLCLTCSEKVLSKYVFYFLSKKNFYLKSKVRKGAIPRLSRKVVETLIIPIINTELQKVIIKQLDTFEASISNLEAQLAQRQKQYEYYRNQLLTFE